MGSERPRFRSGVAAEHREPRCLANDDDDGTLGRFTPSDMSCDRETGRVIDELENHAFPATGQHILGPVELPARVRHRRNEPMERGPGVLSRFDSRNAGITEDPRQRGRRSDRGHAQRLHLLVNTDRAVIEPRLLERRWPDVSRQPPADPEYSSAFEFTAPKPHPTSEPNFRRPANREM
jgi:hypothetical protein